MENEDDIMSPFTNYHESYISKQDIIHQNAVKKQNVSCQVSIPYPVDNSDSPSVVEQSQQGISFSHISFIIPCLWLCGIYYALCLLPSLLQCGLEIFCCWVDP